MKSWLKLNFRMSVSYIKELNVNKGIVVHKSKDSNTSLTKVLLNKKKNYLINFNNKRKIITDFVSKKEKVRQNSQTNIKINLKIICSLITLVITINL